MSNNISEALLLKAAKQFGTPLWVYDAQTIRDQIAKLKQFDIIRFAQKASSNIHLLKLMREEGVKVDAVSFGELKRSLIAGFNTNDIVFTSDVITPQVVDFVVQHDIAVNVGSLGMLERIGKAHKGHHVWLRINPGFGHGHSQKTNTGGEHSKHGIWYSDIEQAIALVKQHDLHLEGIHMHIGSGVDYQHLEQVCQTMVDLVKSLNHDIQAISAGGGLSIPYEDGEPTVDTAHYFTLWNSARKQIEAFLGHQVKLEIEPGRFLVAQAGKLISEVHTIKHTPKHQFVLLDTGFNSLLRPAFYGSYHEMSILGKTGNTVPVCVGGPLCESGDVFTVDATGVILSRELPQAEIGDLLIIHDTGAYGSVMSSNYNTYGLAPEVLIDKDDIRLIRRGQTPEELIALEQF